MLLRSHDGSAVDCAYECSAASGYDGAAAVWMENAGYVLGVILSATDPVAVVALLKELGVKAELSIGIEGESLLNDGTALVIFQVMWPLIQLPMAPPPDPAEVAWMFLFKAVVGAAWGAAIGFISVGWLSTIFNQPLIEITITLASSYLAFYTAEALHMSGVLSVVALGLWMGKHGKTRISPEVEHFLEEFWEMLAYVGNTLIFLIAGLVMGTKLEWELVTGYDVGVLLLMYVVCAIVRASLVFLVYAFLYLLAPRRGRRAAVEAAAGGVAV